MINETEQPPITEPNNEDAGASDAQEMPTATPSTNAPLPEPEMPDFLLEETDNTLEETADSNEAQPEKRSKKQAKAKAGNQKKKKPNDSAAGSSDDDTVEKAVEESADDSVAEVAKTRPEPPPKPKKLPYKVVQLIDNFSACGRCSYFLAGYRVLQGDEGLETAVSKHKADTLPFVWSFPMRDLLVRSYGTRFDSDLLYFNGSCPECKRPFTYKQDDADPPNEQFAIEYRLNKSK